ncbi:hypothetical protein Tsubulata_040934, partial [Turnera subulata]
RRKTQLLFDRDELHLSSSTAVSGWAPSIGFGGAYCWSGGRSGAYAGWHGNSLPEEEEAASTTHAWSWSTSAPTRTERLPLLSNPVANPTFVLSHQASFKRASSSAGETTSTIPFEDLVKATQSFCDSNLLGQGGFGFVHKGVLEDGRVVAIKKLKAGSGQGEREFQAEIETISRIHHRHLVALVGYCIEEAHRILVGLRSYTVISRHPISFLMIALNQSYMAPEYASSGKLTEKSDIFSFGVVLLQLITGRRPVDRTQTALDDSLVDWARPLLKQALEDKNFDDVVDPRLSKNYDPNEMERMIACAAACVRHSARFRPRMSQIFRALEGNMSLDELSEGAAIGHSTIFSTEGSEYSYTQYNEDLKKFKQLALGGLALDTSGSAVLQEYSGPSSDNPQPSSSSSSEGHEIESQPKQQNVSHESFVTSFQLSFASSLCFLFLPLRKYLCNVFFTYQLHLTPSSSSAAAVVNGVLNRVKLHHFITSSSSDHCNQQFNTVAWAAEGFDAAGGSGGADSRGSTRSDASARRNQIPPPLKPSPSSTSGGSSFDADKPLRSPGFPHSTFSYEELAAATDDFSPGNLLGQGGFGYVHKGVLADGKVVAIKQLKAGSLQGEREFSAEVEIISRVHHRHLGRPCMEWSTRMRIALGAAKGNPKIIHRDIKAANILLDYKFEAKVADFGLARCFEDTDTHVSTRVVGTFGYLAPEYACTGNLTDKSDVFSFGVVLLELITGRRPVDRTKSCLDESI